MSTLNPQEIEKFNAIAEKWWDNQGPMRPLHDLNPVRLNFIKKYVDLNQKFALDIGCGAGILSESLAKLGATVMGLDAAEHVIQAARVHQQDSLPNLSYFHGVIEEFEHSEFDVISCMEMLEHVDSPQEVLNHCHRLLKPGGWLFLSTINRHPMAYLKAIIGAEYVLKLLPKQTHDYKKFIKPSELSNMVMQAGFEVVSISGMHYNPFTYHAKLTDSVQVNYLMAVQKKEI